MYDMKNMQKLGLYNEHAGEAMSAFMAFDKARSPTAPFRKNTRS
ncbi:hypothetical protein FHS62_001539 [Amphiplicatus metriothermophilus]|nr:hypothetical protein [Amphiplicatus metriothermophilus]MBB5518741.1 hypothetical protein [Amphiplicatus metriothermophilus]